MNLSLTTCEGYFPVGTIARQGELRPTHYCGNRLAGGDAKYAFDSASLLVGVTLSGSIRTMRYTM